MRSSAILRLLVLSLILSTAPLAALMQDSAFLPQIRSMKRSSLLSQNPNYQVPNCPLRDEGLSHPFRSVDNFLDHLKSAIAIDDQNFNLISYRHAESRFQADFSILAGYEHKLDDDRDYGFLYKGWDITAGVGERLSFSSLWYNGAYYGDLDAVETDELIDGYYKRFAKHIQLDNMSGAISYDTERYSLALGRGRFQIGPSISGSIILSDRVNDYGYFLAEGRAGAFSLSFLHGSLIADSTYSVYDNSALDTRNYPDKFIALHQLNYRPNPMWNLYLGESVVYGNRGIDLNYLLPNSFWRAVEHNLWDRDNVLIYAGAEHKLSNPITLYGQVAIDEFSYGKLFSNWWGNKYALQGGIDYKRIFDSTTLELTAVRPYTYTHFQNHTMYSHDGRPLGYELGSNVLNLSFEHYRVLREWLEWTLHLSYSYRGSEGRDWRENYHDVFAGQIDDAEVKWFAGDISRDYTLSNSITIGIYSHHKLLLGHRSQYIDDWQHRLFAAWQFRF